MHTHTYKNTQYALWTTWKHLYLCTKKKKLRTQRNIHIRVRLTNIYTTAATALLSSSCRLWCIGRCFKTGTSFGRRSWSHTNVQYHWYRWYAATAVTPVGRYRKSSDRWSGQLVSIAGRKFNDKQICIGTSQVCYWRSANGYGKNLNEFVCITGECNGTRQRMRLNRPVGRHNQWPPPQVLDTDQWWVKIFFSVGIMALRNM